MNRALTIMAEILAAGLLTANGQVNVLSDLINFRTDVAADRNRTTYHYGNIEFQGNATTNNAVIYAINESGVAGNRYAVRGVSKPANGYGYGGWFEGGYIGIQGNSNMGSGGNSNRYGGYFSGAGGSGSNYGVYAYAGAGGSARYGLYADAGGSGNDWAVWANGDGWSTGSWKSSDARFKTDAQPVQGAVGKIMLLKPQSFTYDAKAQPGINFPAERQYGLMAQDLEQVFPEMVRETILPDTSNDAQKEPVTFKSVNYDALIPILIAAIQEQQREIEELKARR